MLEAAHAFRDEKVPPPPTATGGEVVHRPEPGLARGLWEAEPWLLWLFAALALLGLLAYLARRMRSRPKQP